MLEIEYYSKKVEIKWYTQDLFTASLDLVYGQELLSRGFLVNDKSLIKSGKLFGFLKGNQDVLLHITMQQLSDFFINKRYYHKINNSIWINISGSLLVDEYYFSILYEKVLRQIDEEDRKKLVLEVSEDSVIDSIVVKRVNNLRKIGYRVAMDDFGTGYSNLVRMSEINFDIIKLDLNLIKNVPNDLWATSHYREIVGLCSSKGTLVVAEGVENKAQSDFVRWSGVDIIQGFFHSSPQPII